MKQKPFDVDDAIKRAAICRATRERVGLTRDELARLVNVSERSVKMWESHSGDGSCPDDVIELLYELLDKQDDDVARAVELAKLVISSAGHRPDTLILPYYPRQLTYKECHPDSSGFYCVVNATLRAIAVELERLGIEVEWRYATPEIVASSDFGWLS